MAITRTAKSTASNKTSGTTLTLASVAMTAGDLLVVSLAYDDETLNSVTWGTEVLTLGDPVLGAGVRTRLAWKVIATTGTQTITATWANPLVAKAFVAASYHCSTAGQTLVEDSNATNAGTGTAASTAAVSPAIVGGTDSMLVAVVGTEGPSSDTAGTWVTPSTNGQRVGTTGNPAAGNVTVSEAYTLGPTAGSTPALSKTGMTSRDWGAAIRAFYWGAAPPIAVSGTAAGSTTQTATATAAWKVSGSAAGSTTTSADITLTPGGGGGGGTPTFRSATTKSGANAKATSFVINTPAGVTDGDTLFLFVNHMGSQTVTTPSGWNLVGAPTTGTGTSDDQVHIFSRTASSEPASYTISLGFSYYNAAMLAYTGATETVEAMSNTGVFGDTSTNLPAPSVTTLGANRLLLAFFGQNLFPTGTSNLQPPTGMTSRGASEDNNNTLLVAEEIVASAGATGTRTATTSLPDSWEGGLLAIVPSSTGGSSLAVSGTAAGTASQAAAATVAWAATGSAAGVGAQTANAVAARPVGGSAAGATTQTGNAVAARPLVGSAAGAATQTGAVGAALPVAGSSAGAATQTATVTRLVQVAGSAAGVAGSTASGGFSLPVAGSAAGNSTVNGAVSNIVAVAGSAASVTATTGVIALASAITSTSAGTGAATGSARAAWAAAATVAGVGTLTGNALAAHQAVGSAAGLSTPAATATGARPAIGSAAGVGALSGAIVDAMAVTAQAAGTSTATGNATSGSEVAIVGTAAGSSAVAGDGRIAAAATASATASATVAGAIGAGVGVTGLSTGAATGSAIPSMGGTLDIFGAAHGTSILAGLAATQIGAAGALAGTSGYIANAVNDEQAEGSAAGSASTNAIPSSGSEIPVMGTAFGSSTIAAAPHINQHAVAQIAGASSTAAAVAIAAHATATAGGDSAIAGEIAALMALAGAAHGSSVNSGSPLVIPGVNLREVVVALTAQAVASASVSVRQPGTTSLTASSGATAGLTPRDPNKATTTGNEKSTATTT